MVRYLLTCLNSGRQILLMMAEVGIVHFVLSLLVVCVSLQWVKMSEAFCKNCCNLSHPSQMAE